MVSSGFFLPLHALKKGHYVDMKKIVLLRATMLGALGIMTSCEDDTQEPEPLTSHRHLSKKQNK